MEDRSKIRTVIFGMRIDGRVQRVAPVRGLTAEDCGLYVHHEDAAAFLVSETFKNFKVEDLVINECAHPDEPVYVEEPSHSKSWFKCRHCNKEMRVLSWGQKDLHD